MIKFDFVLPILIGIVHYSLVCILARMFITVPSFMSKSDRDKYLREYVSFIHSIQAFILSFISYVASGGVDYNGETEYSQVVTLSIYIGFLTYDTIYSEICKIHDWPVRIHHFFTISGCFIILISSRGGSIGQLTLLLAEIPSSLFQFSYILKAEKKENTRAYKIVSATFFVTFLFNSVRFT